MSAALGIDLLVAAALAAIVFSLLRHAASTLLVVVVPLALVHGAVGAVAPPLVDAGFVFVLTAALPVAARHLRLVCDGMPPRQAFAAALRRSGLLGVLALGALSLPLLLMAAHEDMIALAAVLGAFVLTLAALGLGIHAPYTEDFVARANRARERRETAMTRLDVIAQPRWGFAVLGTATILGTLEGFGLKGLGWQDGAAIYFPLVAFCLLLAGLAAIRDWRLAVAAALTQALVIGLTFAARTKGHAGPLPALHLAWAAGALPLWMLGASWRRALNQGGEPAAALMRALREDGPAAFAAALLGALPGLVLLCETWPRPWPVAVAACAVPFAMFPIFPGIGIAIYALLPRYRSVDEVFGRR